jgi:hypothetical protein
MNKIVEPLVYVAVFSALAYYAYRMIKSGLEPPPLESRDLVVGYDDDGTPIVDPDCDIDRTLDFWKEQSRLFRNA